jgi:hypothetical protein
MKNKEEIKEILNHLQIQNKEVKFDEEVILAEYQKNEDHQSLAIKILSVCGGILASLTFLAFMFLVGLYDSDIGLISLGSLSIIGGVLLSRKYGKIILDTFSVSAYIIGFVLIGAGLVIMEVDKNIISLIFMIIAIASLVIVPSYILNFISVLIISGATIVLILSNNIHDAIHFYISIVVLLTTFFFLKEARIISLKKSFSAVYSPIRIALVFSFLAGLILVGKYHLIPFSSDYLWISSVVIIANILFLIPKIFTILNISATAQKIGIYCISLAVLLPTMFCPGISGAILIILLSFLVNYKTSLVIGIVAFIYFISQYYYDLNITLLTKSIILFSSGILFIGLYLLTHKKLTSNEKV